MMKFTDTKEFKEGKMLEVINLLHNDGERYNNRGEKLNAQG